jgi:predicted Zn-dependent protease
MGMRWEDRLVCAEGFAELHMFDEALKELRAIEAPNRRQEAVLFLKYQIFAARGKWKAAALVTRYLVTEYPTRPLYWLASAACARQLGSLDAAESILTTACDLHPDNGPIWYALATCASLSGRLDDARQWAFRAIQHEPRLQQRFIDDQAMKPIWDTIP